MEPRFNEVVGDRANLFVKSKLDITNLRANDRNVRYIEVIIGTFRSEDEDDYEYEFSVLSMRIRFGGRYFSKCACSEQKTRTRGRPRPPI